MLLVVLAALCAVVCAQPQLTAAQTSAQVVTASSVAVVPGTLVSSCGVRTVVVFASSKDNVTTINSLDLNVFRNAPSVVATVNDVSDTVDALRSSGSTNYVLWRTGSGRSLWTAPADASSSPVLVAFSSSSEVQGARTTLAATCKCLASSFVSPSGRTVWAVSDGTLVKYQLLSNGGAREAVASGVTSLECAGNTVALAVTNGVLTRYGQTQRVSLTPDNLLNTPVIKAVLTRDELTAVWTQDTGVLYAHSVARGPRLIAVNVSQFSVSADESAVVYATFEGTLLSFDLASGAQTLLSNAYASGEIKITAQNRVLFIGNTVVITNTSSGGVEELTQTTVAQLFSSPLSSSSPTQLTFSNTSIDSVFFVSCSSEFAVVFDGTSMFSIRLSTGDVINLTPDTSANPNPISWPQVYLSLDSQYVVFPSSLPSAADSPAGLFSIALGGGNSVVQVDFPGSSAIGDVTPVSISFLLFSSDPLGFSAVVRNKSSAALAYASVAMLLLALGCFGF